MKVGNIIDFNEANTLRAALAYAERGWHVLPCWRPEHDEDGQFISCGCKNPKCSSPGKHPHGFLAPRGQMQATTDPEIIKKWFAYGHKLNIAVQLSSSGLVAIDVDPRNGGLFTFEQLEAKHGRISSGIEQFTGGGGQHFIYSNPHGVNGLPGDLGPGVDLKANGYIMVWPSMHASGVQYEFEDSSDPLHGAVPSPLPDWIRSYIKKDSPMGQPGSRYADPKQIEDLRSALKYLSSDDYHRWVNYGQALKALGGAGFEVWDEWSKTSDKYNDKAMGFKWRSFKSGAFQIESIFHEAQDHGWINPMTGISVVDPVPMETVKVHVPFVDESPLPSYCGQSAPGILGTLVDWINDTSRKPQPEFAVQTALAFASTILGRRYVTSQRNWSALYFLNIGKSASGKEHAKWAIETLLEACNLPHMIGPAGYTSDSGLLSRLCDQPVHCTVIDEFGKVLESATVKNNSRASTMLRALMEAWGRCDGVMRPQGYSTFGMSESEARKISEKSVRNPSLTLIAMTTPETLYETIGSAAARDGFLNRFLMVDTDIGRQVGRHVPRKDIPASILNWVQRMHQPFESHLVKPDSNASLSPDAQEIHFEPKALALFEAFESECIDLMNEAEKFGMAEMWGRANEIAMKVSLIAAMGCDASRISQDHAAWSIDYVRRSFSKIVEKLKTHVADSEFESVMNQVLIVIRNAGERGMTEKELNDFCRKFRTLDKRGKLNVLDTLAFGEDIAKVSFPPLSGRGKPRVAWVAIDGINEDK